MAEYIIITDSSCDLTDQMAREMQIEVVPLTLLMEGKTYKNYLDGREINVSDFYAALRGGSMATTSAANINDFAEAFELFLQQGKDVLYLGFSSGLSATFQCGANAAQMLSEKYPDRKVYAVDTLCASLGQGMLVYLAAKQRDMGKTIEEVRDYVENNKLNLCHWFTVDDLHFLKRGGRISAATELIGTVLGVKPVMHVDNEGHLIKVEVAKGRKGSIRRLKEHMESSAINPQEQEIFISHGDCLADAQLLADMVKKQFGVKEVYINHVGPVIGSHSGPGTLALFFLGKER